MTQLFDRQIELTLLRPQPDSFFGRFLPNQVTIRNMRVVFSIKKSLKEEPNDTVIKVYNLAPATRAMVQTKPLHVTLDVGYKGAVKRLFAGDLTFSDNNRIPTGWETVIELGDGDRSYNHSNIYQTFKAGTSSKDIIKSVANSMGLKVPSNVEEAKALGSQFATGVTLRGPSRVEMTRILQKSGMKWSIQDGKLQILEGFTPREGEAFLISQKTGMVGSPEMTAPKQPGEPAVLKCKALVYPDLVPGYKIKLESRKLNGTFRISQVVHTGDTHSLDWYTEIEATPV